MSSTVTLKASGLQTSPNVLEVPEGALLAASNIIIRRDDVIEPRRGFKLFGTSFGTSTDRLKQLFVYKKRILRHYDSTIEFDSGTTNNAGEELFLPFDGLYLEAQAGLRIKSVESNGNFYFTTSEGIKKISALTTSDLSTSPGFITQAGGIKALDITAVLNTTLGNQTGFLPQDSAVAYRAVWGTKDLNGNLILGTPSQRAEVYNPLISLLIGDFNNTLQAIQNTADQPSPNNSLISDSDYVSSLSLGNSADANQLNGKLLALSNKLDNDLLFADTVSAPLTIDSVEITNNPPNNVCKITFSSGDPTQYFSIGRNIFLSNFANAETGLINGPQVISAVDNTSISFITAATGNTGSFVPSNVSTTTPWAITLTSHGFSNKDPIRFTTTTALPSPLTLNTTYYIGNVTTDTFQVYTDQALTSQVQFTDQGTGTHTVTFYIDITSTTIVGYDFRSITPPVTPAIPATDADLVSQQDYLINIINRLQTYPTTGTPPIISAYSQANYITFLTTTNTANVDLDITIPQNVTPNYFFQIYRSPIISATDVAVLSNLVPSDELQLVYEAFPTAAELIAGVIHVTDITPDSFAGASLYTNEASGEGITQANDIPPFALDINRFKNTVFYANTRTKYRELLSLLGVSKMITDFENGIIPQLTISDGIISNTYSFVEGVNQVTQVTMVADVSDSLNGKYFLINSAENEKSYYIWYKTSGGATSDPSISGSIGVEVFINTNDSDVTVAQKTSDVINTILLNDLVSLRTSNFINITNVNPGYTNFATAGTSGFTVTTPVPGAGQKITQEIDTFTTVADVSGNLGGKYFTFNTAFNKQQYYIWYKVSGSGADPAPAGKTGILVQLTLNDSASVVAQKTSDAIMVAVPTKLKSSHSTNTITITSIAFGPTATPTVATSGFTLTNVTSGALQVLLSDQVSPAKSVDATARSLVQVINRNLSDNVYAFYLSGAGTVPGQILLESRDLNTPQFYTVANNSNTGSSFNPDLSPKIAITSISVGDATHNLVTTATAHGLSNGGQVVIVGTDSIPNANGLYTITYVSPTTFRIPITITSAATMGSIISAANAVAGSNEVKINRIYYSKFQQPEAVPITNFLDVGASDKAILRIFPLRDSLFVFKEDGLFRISGEVAPFNLALFDSSCVAIAPDSISVANNLVYAWTTQGVVTVTESGVSLPAISRPIDNIILQLGSSNYPSFGTATWGIGYESDNSYIVFTVKQIGDTEATIGYRYSNLTNTWTTYDKTDTCGIIGADDRLYLGAGDTNFLEQERKTFTRLDYADREIVSSLDDGNFFGTNIKVPNTTQFVEGDVVTQVQNLTVYEFNALLQKLDIDTNLLSSSITSISTGLIPTITTSSNHLLVTGNTVRISGSNTTPNIDGLYTATVLSSTTFSISVGVKPIITAGTTGIAKYMYLNNLEVAGGIDLNTALTSLVSRLNIEPSLVYKKITSTISSNSIANPTIVTTTAPHNLGSIGLVRKIKISGNTGSSPDINGNYEATVVSATEFSIPINVTTGGTGGTLVTLDDYLSIISNITGTITNIGIGNPTIITSPNHGLVANRYVEITGSNSTPSIDGNYLISLIDENSFSIPATVSISGTSGNFITLIKTFQDIQVVYNDLITTLNADTGTAFNNYSISTSQTIFEDVIISVNNNIKQLTLNLALNFVVGPLVIYKAISTTYTYAPVTFKDTLNLKHIYEATLMFENKAFTEATLSFSSDLLPKFNDIPFNGDGNGIFGIGTGPFGNRFFGGGSNAAPFRTYIPRDNQRCRYLIIKFAHRVAREKYSINGLTLTGNIQQSTRAYR